MLSLLKELNERNIISHGDYYFAKLIADKQPTDLPEPVKNLAILLAALCSWHYAQGNTCILLEPALAGNLFGLAYRVTERNYLLDIQHRIWHRIEALTDDLECSLAFYCKKEDYFSKKYNMTATHGDVVDATKIIKPCKVLDLGCGQGRNSLYLSLLGYDVTAWDHNENSLQFLNEVKEKENLKIQTALYNINEANIQENYDFIVSTVVFMFLDRTRVPAILENMQNHTNPGGYNLIVAAMSTPEVPCPLPFSFTFGENELKEYYKDWEFLEYNENMGELHKTDENGNRYKMKFVTMLARKK